MLSRHADQRLVFRERRQGLLFGAISGGSKNIKPLLREILKRDGAKLNSDVGEGPWLHQVELQLKDSYHIFGERGFCLMLRLQRYEEHLRLDPEAGGAHKKLGPITPQIQMEHCRGCQFSVLAPTEIPLWYMSGPT